MRLPFWAGLWRAERPHKQRKTPVGAKAVGTLALKLHKAR